MQNNVIKVSSEHGKMEERFLEQQRYLFVFLDKITKLTK